MFPSLFLFAWLGFPLLTSSVPSSPRAGAGQDSRNNRGTARFIVSRADDLTVSIARYEPSTLSARQSALIVEAYEPHPLNLQQYEWIRESIRARLTWLAMRRGILIIPERIMETRSLSLGVALIIHCEYSRSYRRFDKHSMTQGLELLLLLFETTSTGHAGRFRTFDHGVWYREIEIRLLRPSSGTPT